MTKPPLPKGVTKRWNRYIATARDVDGTVINLGIFLTAKEADDAIIRFISRKRPLPRRASVLARPGTIKKSGH